jgi:NAD(P)-dependent dehydrogenase (short-subunit alcohol dehydrogenase family)
VFAQSDGTDENDCRKIIETVVGRFGRLDGLVNNAGIFPEVSFEQCNGALFDKLYAVNARRAFLCSKYAAIQMEKNDGRSIVHIGSTHTFGASPNYAVYGTSKGALFSLSDF